MKRILILSLALALGLGAQAQHFEWATQYGNGNGTNIDITGSITDSLGNLYILGKTNLGGKWQDGTPLLPANASVSGQWLALIAKISPEGDLVWHKAITGHTTSATPYDIRALGDTAFAILVDVPRATSYNSLYYLDTMINASGFGNPSPDYPMGSGAQVDFLWPSSLALIILDFDGNLLEHHFLQMTYVDDNGEDITHRSVPSDSIPELCSYYFAEPSFDIDAEGNIYLIRSSGIETDIPQVTSTGEIRHYSALDGTLTAVKFWCDQRLVGVTPIDSATVVNHQLLKFSPHFDTLLQYHYVFRNFSEGMHFRNPLRVDKYGRLYTYSMMYSRHRDTTYCIDSARNLSFHITANDVMKSYLIVYSCDSLQPTNLISLDIERAPEATSIVSFNDIAFDYRYNLLFIQCYAGALPINGFRVSYRGQPLPFKKSANFFALKMDDDFSLYSAGGVESGNLSGGDQYHFGVGNLVCKNHRVFMQSACAKSVTYADNTYEFNPNEGSVCLTIFDYRGNIIGGGPYWNRAGVVGPLALRDSILYVSLKPVGPATFGDIQVNQTSNIVIAKYVDESFMTPYKMPDDPGVRVEVVQDDGTVVCYPNPTTGRLTIVMNGRRLSQAYLAGADGKAQPLAVSPAGDDRYSADLSAFPDGSYTLILFSDPSHAYQSQVILQRR